MHQDEGIFLTSVAASIALIFVAADSSFGQSKPNATGIWWNTNITSPVNGGTPTPANPGNTVPIIGTVSGGPRGSKPGGGVVVSGQQNNGGVITPTKPKQFTLPVTGNKPPYGFDSGTNLGGFTSGSWTITAQPVDAKGGNIGTPIAISITVP